MSKLEVDAIEPQSGTTITIGAAGDTVNLVGTLQSNGSALPGDISSVVAGTGLSGGGTTGAVTINIDSAQPTITSLGTLTGLTTTGDILFGDSDKAIFGAGSDFQMYHDGNNSIITEEGGGNFQLRTNGPSINLQKGNSEDMAVFTADGSVSLYHNNAKKFETTSTGIDVTGTAVTDGLTVSGTGVVANFTSTNNNTVLRLKGSNATNGGALGSTSSGELTFLQNLSEGMRLDTSGRLLVGKTGIGDDTVGVEIRGDGLGQFTRSGNKVLMLNRKSSDGAIQEFRKDNTKVGTISCDASQNLTIQGKASSDFSIVFAPNKLNPKNYAGTGAKDNAVDLGDNDDRWKDIYLGGGAYIGGTGTANKLDDYEEGTFTPNLSTSTGVSLPLNSGIDVMSYTKIGRMVHIQGLIRLASLTNPSGAFFQIIGLPFTTASSITQYGGRGGGGIYYDDAGTGKSILPFTFSENQTRFNVYKDASTLAVNDDFQIALTYFTN